MAFGIALILATLPCTASAQPVPEPESYRLDDYRAPVPAVLSGGTVVGPEEALTLWQAGDVAFIDVMPRAPKPANLPEGTIWRDKPRQSIPGAIWLPNVGYGKIADVTAAYFQQGLDKVTDSNRSHAVLFFCLEDCWMSWNAARRAIEWGYTDVYWLPEGTDGWRLWDLPLEPVEPEEPQPQTGN
ncbi:MAG: PQQ-dependent catabolism-associated CXXCW motif protein [Pseudomonadota bacterium]